MERADPGLTGGLLQIDLSVRMSIDPKRGFHRPAAVADSRRHGLAPPSGNRFDETAGEYLSDLVEADIAAAVGGGLRELAEHHQFGQRRRAADPPDFRAVADRFHQFRSQKERQALVAADMVVGADIVVAGMADQHRSRHQFEEAAAAVAAEAAFADKGEGMAAMLLRERRVIRSRAAAELGHRDR